MVLNYDPVFVQLDGKFNSLEDILRISWAADSQQQQQQQQSLVRVLSLKFIS
jgi:hypothetical protein